MMISIEKLTEKFGPALEVAPWGSCLWILGTEFNPDWEAELDDLGYICQYDILDGAPGIFVELKKEVVVKVKKMVKTKLWTDVEDDLLVSLWTVEPQLSVSEIASKFKAKFPSRSGSGVANRIQQLQQKEKRIEPRFIINKSGTSKEAKSILQGEQFPAVKVDDCAENISVLEEIPVEDADVLVNLVKEVTVLREGYDSLNKAYVALQTKIECIWQDTEKTLMSFANEMPSNEDLATVRKDLLVHEHSEKSGKVTLPMEASS